MLKLLALFIAAAYAQATPPPGHYLIHKDHKTCQQRSQQQCQALGCDGVNTIYWWDCSTGPLKAGVAGGHAVPKGSHGMRIELSGPFSATTSSPTSGGPVGLTAQEQKDLVTHTEIAPILPPPPASLQ